MKKLVHYIIIFLVIYWCFNNINGCSVGKDIKVPQIESEGHQCEGCTSPIEEVPQEELDSTNANTCYKYLKGAILNTEPHPNTFVELNHKIDVQSPRCIVVTIEYTIVNDINQLNVQLQNPTPEMDPRDLYNHAEKVKSKIMKMRKDGLAERGEFSVENLVFKKLRNEGYIQNRIDLISRSYEKIYNE